MQCRVNEPNESGSNEHYVSHRIFFYRYYLVQYGDTIAVEV